MQAFIPEQSPPLVRIPIFFIYPPVIFGNCFARGSTGRYSPCGADSSLFEEEVYREVP
jgi:hypothetical protein